MPEIFSCSIIDLWAHSKPHVEAFPSVGRSSLWWRKRNDFSQNHLKEKFPSIFSIFIIGHPKNTFKSRSFRQWIIVYFTILHYVWTWHGAQRVMELTTASHKPMKLQARYVKGNKVSVFYFISCSQIIFCEKKKQTKQTTFSIPSNVFTWRGME